MPRRYAASRDANEPRIFDELVALGFFVRRFDTPMDLLVKDAGVEAFWVEVKDREHAIAAGRRTQDARPALWDQYEPNRERLRFLTQQQRDFVAEYPGPWLVAMSSQEVVDFWDWLKPAS